MKIEIELDDILKELEQDDEKLAEFFIDFWKRFPLGAFHIALENEDVNEDIRSLVYWTHLDAKKIITDAMEMLDGEAYDDFLKFAHDLYWGYVKALKKRDIFNSLDQATIDYCGLQKDVKVKIQKQ